MTPRTYRRTACGGDDRAVEERRAAAEGHVRVGVAAPARLVVLMAWTAAVAAGLTLLHRVDPGDAARGTPVDAAVPVVEGVRLGGLVLGWYVLAVTVVGLAARLARAPLLTAVVDRLSTRTLRRVLDLATGMSVATAAVLAPVPGVSGTAVAVAAAGGHDSPPATIRRLPDEGAQLDDSDDDSTPGPATASPATTDEWPPFEAEIPDAAPHGSSGDADPAGGGAPVDTSGEPSPDALLNTVGDQTGSGLPDHNDQSKSPETPDGGGGAAPTSAPDRPLAPSPPSWPVDAAADADAHDQPGAGGGPAASSSLPAPGPSSRPVPAPRPGTAPVASPRTYEVRSGDHFWSIATRVLAEAWGREPTVTEVAPYWRSLVEANGVRLVRRNDANLIRPGQVFDVPEPPAEPPAEAPAEPARPP